MRKTCSSGLRTELVGVIRQTPSEFELSAGTEHFDELFAFLAVERGDMNVRGGRPRGWKKFHRGLQSTANDVVE